MSQHDSYWMATCPLATHAPLAGDIDVDVAVIGGGIVGILTAARLKEAGLNVALIESRTLASRVTGYTTAKLTAVHTTIYSKLQKHFGEEKARLYAQANSGALRWAEQQISMRGIDCDYQRVPLSLYVDKTDEVDILQEEREAATKAGLTCELLASAGAPFPTTAALSFPDQIQFHIRKFLQPFADSLAGSAYENTRALSVEEGDPCTVTTERGTVRAKHVVLATMFPIFDPGMYWARLNVYRDYAMAARLRAPMKDEMFVGAGETTYTYRTSPDPQGQLLIVSGLHHKEGEHADLREYYRQMEEHIRAHFDVSEIAFYWSSQDYKTLDGVPYIGRISPNAERVFVATGFDAWGMSTGIVASEMLAEMVQGRKSPYKDLYDPNRFKPTASIGQLGSNVANATKHLVIERIGGAAKLHSTNLQAGEGAVLDTEEGKACIYKDEAGALHALSPYCTHMGCQLSWNGAEKSWDCGCHGSRFTIDGKVIQGPAVKDLETKPID